MVENDSNPYAQFRAACALFAHGDRSKEVIQKLSEFLNDEDTREIAEGYLAELEN